MRRLALAVAAAFLLTAGTAEAAKPTIVLVHGAFADASGSRTSPTACRTAATR